MDVRRNSRRDPPGAQVVIQGNEPHEKSPHQPPITGNLQLCDRASLHDSRMGNQVKFTEDERLRNFICHYVAAADVIHFHPDADRAKRPCGKPHCGESGPSCAQSRFFRLADMDVGCPCNGSDALFSWRQWLLSANCGSFRFSLCMFMTLRSPSLISL